MLLPRPSLALPMYCRPLRSAEAQGHGLNFYGSVFYRFWQRLLPWHSQNWGCSVRRAGRSGWIGWRYRQGQNSWQCCWALSKIRVRYRTRLQRAYQDQFDNRWWSELRSPYHGYGYRPPDGPWSGRDSTHTFHKTALHPPNRILAWFPWRCPRQCWHFHA